MSNEILKNLLYLGRGKRMEVLKAIDHVDVLSSAIRFSRLPEFGEVSKTRARNIDHFINDELLDAAREVISLRKVQQTYDRKLNLLSVRKLKEKVMHLMWQKRRAFSPYYPQHLKWLKGDVDFAVKEELVYDPMWEYGLPELHKALAHVYYLFMAGFYKICPYPNKMPKLEIHGGALFWQSLGSIEEFESIKGVAYSEFLDVDEKAMQFFNPIIASRYRAILPLYQDLIQGKKVLGSYSDEGKVRGLPYYFNLVRSRGD